MRYQFEMKSPLGTLRLFSRGEVLIGLYFEHHSPAPKDDSGRCDAKPFETVIDQLEQYFAGARSVFELPIAFAGTVFQRDVWNALRRIPPGSTKTYSQLAHSLGRPQAMRAVGAAVGRNPISIIVPCHRVVGADGSLTGFAGGLERKQWLLEREGVLSATT